MIKITKTDIHGWQTAIRGMRNPFNSWDKSDSRKCEEKGCSEICENCFIIYICDEDFYCIGENDHELMMKLARAGTDHSKYRRFINVTCDIVAPLYWWKEMDTYKVGTVANSCSTMHKVADREFTLDDFSCEHLLDGMFVRKNDEWVDQYENPWFGSNDVLQLTIELLNYHRVKYLKTGNKEYWWQIIQLLPSSYNQRRTMQLNYEVLANIYKSRKNHKLDEWREFCDWIKELPYAELITLGE